MSFRSKLWDEIVSLTVAFLYFMVWIGALALLKKLILAEYHISSGQWSLVLIGALVLAKVVLILEHVSFGAWVRARPAILDVILRTILYTAGVFVVMILEKGLEGRHEYGGFAQSVVRQLKAAGGPHIWVNTICLSGALLGYNVISVIRQQLGEKGLRRLLLSPLPGSQEA
jgi:hypothetical protein